VGGDSGPTRQVGLFRRWVESRVDAQRRVYRIRPEPIMELDTWMAPFRRFWCEK